MDIRGAIQDRLETAVEDAAVRCAVAGAQASE
jgi:hypothetical protein